MALRTEWSSIKIVANDLKQADSRVFFYLRRAILLNPALRSTIRIVRYLVELPNNSRIEALPIDPTGEAGGNDDMIVFSELWGAKDDAAKLMWAEMTLSPTKFGKSFRWVESYAGFEGESQILKQQYDAGVTEGRLLWPDTDLQVYVNDAARLLCLWNTKPRMPWQTPEYYAQEAHALTPNQYARVHENKWVSPEEAFVPPEWWDGCQGNVPAREGAEPMVAGIDAAVKDDCFAIVGITKRDDGMRYVRYCRVWWPPKGGKIDFAEPEAEIRRLAEQEYCIGFAYDPMHILDMATRLENSGLYMVEFNQGVARARADKQLRDMIRDRRIRHEGQPDLAEHIKNANSAEKGDDQLRIVKRGRLKIDACVALSMAVEFSRNINI